MFYIREAEEFIDWDIYKYKEIRDLRLALASRYSARA